MHLYVELWKARPKWLALSQPERQEYLAGIGPDIQRILGLGVELVGFALNDPDTPHRGDYQYLAVWKMPSLELVHELETAVEGAGFHGYFEQINARGELVPPQSVLGNMLNLTE